MSQDTNKDDLPIILFDPSLTSTAKALQRSDALAHAARVSHARREQSLVLPKWRRLPTSPSKQKKGRFISNYTPRPKEISPADVDPFHSMAVPTGPEVPTLVNLWIEFLESYKFNVNTWLNIATQPYNSILANRLQGTIFLYRCSALLLLRNQGHDELTKSWMIYRKRCFEELTTLRADSSQINHVRLIQCFVFAFNAAIFSNDIVEAQLHVGQFLRVLDLSRRARTLSQLEQLLYLTRVLHGDTQCALIHMRPPVVDPEATERFWRSHFEPLVQWLRTHSISVDATQKIALSIGMKELLESLQAYIHMQRVAVPELLRKGEKLIVISSPTVWVQMLVSQLFDRFTISERQYRDSVTLDQGRRWYVEALLTGTSLAVLSSEISGPLIMPTLAQRGYKLFQRLREILERPPDLEDTLNHWDYQYPRVWALYIGAMWEWESGTYDVGHTWFTRHFGVQIKSLGVESWNSVEAIIDSFIYIPAKMQNDVAWFLGADHRPTETGFRPRVPGYTFLKELHFPTYKSDMTRRESKELASMSS